MARLSGRAVILTGGATGIGAHYARALAAEGARVMIVDIAEGAGLAAELARHGEGGAASMVADVADESAVKGLVAAGPYDSADAVVGEALRLLERRDELRREQSDELRAEIALGLDDLAAGRSAPLDMASIRARVAERLARPGKAD